MSFIEESTVYEKTILSDLQGAGSVLRDSIVDNAGFEGWDRAIFHVDEAMSWESERNLKKMKSSLLIVSNIIAQSNPPGEISELLQSVRECFDEALMAIKEGEAE